MQIIIQLERDGNEFVALIGRDLQESISASGTTPLEALRNLAGQVIEAADVEFSKAGINLEPWTEDQKPR